MEATTEARFLQSEYEDNIQRYANYCNGFIAGKSLTQGIKLMNHIHEEEKLFSEEKPLYISFDLEKWSPKMPIENHQFCNELWAEAFGVPSLIEASRIFTDGQLHYVKRNIHHTIDKVGADFEGFAGKKLTFMHIGVMGYAVQRMRELGLIKGKGRFASLIDDGILRVEIPENSYAERVPRILKLVEDVYYMWGLRISWDKTFVSSKFGIFLHNIRLGNCPITPGMRAFVKITNRGDAPAPSLVDDLGILESTVRGAMAAGTPPFVVYSLYIYLALDSMKKWGMSITAAKKIPWLFTPKVMGGLGICQLIRLTGAVSGDALTEGIGVLRAIATRFPDSRPVANKIINWKPERPSGLTVFRNPQALTSSRPIVKQDRLLRVVSREVEGLVRLGGLEQLVREVLFEWLE